MGRKASTFRVVAYHLDGSFYKTFLTAKEACLFLKCHPRTIDKCIRGDTTTAFNFMWRRYPFDSIPEKIEPYKKEEINHSPSRIAEIDINGKIISEYSSIKKASKELGVDPHSIRDVLKGKAKQAKGHIFKYL